MEILRRLGVNHKEEHATQLFTGKIRKHLKNGHVFARKTDIDRLLPLKGNDKTLLHLMIGFQLLNISIEKAKFLIYGPSRVVGGMYGHRAETSKSLRLKEEARNVQDTIDDFISDNYREKGLNRARNIQLAVNQLFVQTQYVDLIAERTEKELNTETVTEWVNQWRARIMDG